MSSQHLSVAVTWTSGGTTHSTTMLEAQFDSKPPRTGERWYTCHICALDYPAKDVVLRGGVAFCIPLGCYGELPEYDRRSW